MLSTGIERSAQVNAVFSINKLVEYWKEAGLPQLVKRVQNDLLAMVLKLHNEFYELLHAVSTCIDVSGISFLEPKLPLFTKKLINILQENPTQPAQYQPKLLALKILEQIAPMLKPTPLLTLIKPI